MIEEVYRFAEEYKKNGLNLESNYVKKVIKERLGSKLADIFEMMIEINFEVLSNEDKYFELVIDDRSFVDYMFSDKLFFTSVSIRLFEKPYIRRFYVIDPMNINKLDILKWMTDLILAGTL